MAQRIEPRVRLFRLPVPSISSPSFLFLWLSLWSLTLPSLKNAEQFIWLSFKTCWLLLYQHWHLCQALEACWYFCLQCSGWQALEWSGCPPSSLNTTLYFVPWSFRHMHPSPQISHQLCCRQSKQAKASGFLEPYPGLPSILRRFPALGPLTISSPSLQECLA